VYDRVLQFTMLRSCNIPHHIYIGQYIAVELGHTSTVDQIKIKINYMY